MNGMWQSASCDYVKYVHVYMNKSVTENPMKV